MKPTSFVDAWAFSSGSDSVLYHCAGVTALVLIAGAIGCSTPTGPTVSLAGAQAVLPAPDAVIDMIASHYQVALTVHNGTATQPGIPVTVTFEVATDPTFTTIVLTKVVPQSAGGQTSVTIPLTPVDKPILPYLGPGSYYWHVRTRAGVAEVTSGSHTFRIAALLQAPSPISPVNGVLIGGNRPVMLAAQNRGVPPTVTAITDTFEVATDPGFTAIVASTSVLQAMANVTTATLAVLPSRVTYYWRVRTEASGAIGAISETAAFRIASIPCDAECPYRLSIDGAGNNCRLTELPDAQPDLVIANFQFDGTLTNEGQARVFGTSTGSLHLRWTPMSSGALTGSLVLNGARPTNYGDIAPWYGLEVTTGNLGRSGFFGASAVDVAGRVSRDGSVSGTFAGTLELRIPTNYIDFLSHCSGSFPWTLTPRE